MDLKELGRKCAAAGLKDVAAYVTMMVKPLSDAVFPSIKSTESICSQAFASHLASVHSAEELHRSGCVLQRLWLRMLGFHKSSESKSASNAFLTNGLPSHAEQSICSQAFSSHMASVHGSEEPCRGGCVLQRLWLRMLGFRHLNESRPTSIAEQPVQQSQKKKKDYLALHCLEMPGLEGEMQQLIDATFKCWGKASGNLPLSVPNAMQIRSVVHVEKQKLYSQFNARRADIGEVLHLCPTELFGIRTPCITEGINEYWLWHGTTPHAAKSIINRGFDLSRAGSGGGSLFGRGICFAESCMKADFYAKSADKRGWYVLLLCRVVLGRVRYCDNPDPDTDELESSCALGRAFHSVVGDREKIAGSFREVVVFDERQVYPEYMVWYTRS